MNATGSAKKAVLFDMDGVLVLTDQLKAEAHSATVRKLGGDVPPGFYQLHMGNSHSRVRGAFIAEAGIECDLAEYTRLYHEIYSNLLDTCLQLAPGAAVLLERLVDCGFVLAVVSSSKAWMMERVLVRTRLSDYFQARVCAEDVHRPKPAPDAYLLAMERLATGRGSAVAVEDSGPGVEAALAAGIPVLAVRTAWNRGHNFSRAATEIDSLEDAPGILEVINRLVVPVSA